MSSEAEYPRIAVTVGEPAGIGPDICLELAKRSHRARLTVFADIDELHARARLLGRPVELREAGAHGAPEVQQPGTLDVRPIPLVTEVRPGKLDARNSEAVLASLTAAGQGCLDGHFDALVTAPVHKGVINRAGVPFSGHTEFLAALCGEVLPVMMLATSGLRVALVTTHLPLKDVPAAITADRLTGVIGILNHDLQTRFGCASPRIVVCGLNPHAGEDGHLGTEEQAVIEPVLADLRRQGMRLVGPLPADTVFTPRHLHAADAVLAMYHDQGLPVLKHMGFGNAVNITLGLPIIRTSVDHGTALDLAGTGRADSGSLLAAVDTALDMVGAGHRPPGGAVR